MKTNKRLGAIIAFSLALIVTATAAYADIAAKTGYDVLKEALKNTTASMSSKLQSFTFDTTVTLKDGDKTLSTTIDTRKYDNQMQSSEYTTETSSVDSISTKSYSYSDKQYMISKNHDTETYNLYEYSNANNHALFTNPFEDEKAIDIEKIADALMGSLKDYVVLEEKTDGSSEIYGSLDEGQIPPLINAVTSFYFKQNFGRESASGQQIPVLTNDICVKSITGRAVINKDGIMESLLATGTLSGKDKNGITHVLTLDMLYRLTSINETIVTKPDLTGKTVEKHTMHSSESKILPSRFVGKYIDDLIIVKNEQFIKVGERFLEVESIVDQRVKVHIYDAYNDAYASEYSDKKLDFSFEANMESDTGAKIEAGQITAEGVKILNMYFDPLNGNINFSGTFSDSSWFQFRKVFEDK